VPGHYPGLGPGLSGPTSPDGLAGLAPHTARGSYPGGGPNPAEEPTFPVRGAGRPTLVLRRRRSRLPVAAVAIVGAAGALVGVLLAVTGDDASTSSRRGPPPAASDNAPAPTAPPAPDPTRAAGAPSVAEPAQPADTTANDKAATAAAKAAEPTDQAAVQPETVASPDDADAKKKLAKPARPKVRAEPKRTDVKRGSKADAKEQTWNADSPFMPVVTPKR
jgi:hypothetical protein